MAFLRKWHKHAGTNTATESALSSNRETDTDKKIPPITQMRAVCCDELRLIKIFVLTLHRLQK